MMNKIVVIGSLNQDSVAQVDHFAQIGETILVDKTLSFAGGKGANQAYAIGKLGGDVAMLGAVGDDDSGTFLLKNLEAVDVNIKNIKREKDIGTGVAWIVVDKNGDNNIIVVQGANQSVDKEYIEQCRNIIDEADIVVLQLEIPIETVCYTAALAKKLGKYVILDPAPAIKELPDELLYNIDLIKPNETELSILTDTDPEDEDYYKKTELLKKRGAKNIVATLGDKGVYMNLADGVTKYFEGCCVEAVDTTAAGDSFLAALAISLANGNQMEDAIAFAQKVAAIVVTRHGAQVSIPSIEEVL